MLSNLACDAATGVPLARHPSLLEAALKALEGPAAVAALLCNLAALEASTRSQLLLEQLQQQRVMTMSMMAVPVFVGGGAPEPENMQVLMMQQQQMFQQHSDDDHAGPGPGGAIESPPPLS